MHKRTLLAAIAVSVMTVLPVVSALADSESNGQAVTETYARQLSAARPYPLGQMNDSSERKGLTEKLLRMNNPNKLGYVALTTDFGQVIATFTIKGKVSSTASQLTNTHNIIVRTCGDKNEDYCAIPVDSMGDDGSYGPEEGGKKGVFFFTTAGVLIEWNGKWQYSDAPILLTSTPLVVLPVGAKPSTNEGYLPGDGQK